MDRISSANDLASLVRRLAVGLAAACALAGCDRAPGASVPSAGVVPALAMVLAPHEGAGEADREIRRFQEQVRRGVNRDVFLERLGWAYVAKARETLDPGYFKLAEACAGLLPADAPATLLLRGHVLHNLHRFRDAEPLARALGARRGLSYDYALLGDVLMELGRIDESVSAYQQAMDLRPDVHSYARAAHVRWLTGDLEGALEMMRSAVGATSPLDPATVAWTCTRFAALSFQADDARAANQACAKALAMLPEYPPALLLEGRMRLGAGDAPGAVPLLERAAAGNPLPDPQWALADALRSAGRAADARAIEAKLVARGALADPRTLSLYLATRGENPGLALRLAEEELRQRQDVFTHDALAWALAAVGRLEDARRHMDLALAEGTEDARLFLHAAVISARAGNVAEAGRWFDRANGLSRLLLPSEQALLAGLAPRLGRSAPVPPKNFPVSALGGNGETQTPTKDKS